MTDFSTRTMVLGSIALAVDIRTQLARQTAFAKETMLGQDGNNSFLATAWTLP